MSMPSRLGTIMLGTTLVCLLTAGVGLADSSGTPSGIADQPGTERMSWLLQRDNLETLALTGQRFDQSEIGGSGGGAEVKVDDPKIQGPQQKKKSGWPVLYSLILPGAGEASMGYTRGYFMMALDIFAWTQVSKYNKRGDQYSDDYYAFADAHYTDSDLINAYNNNNSDIERRGEGNIYFPTVQPFDSASGLDNLPLYVSKEDDYREYYENLGKWDQFIFGWDDYIRASAPNPDYPDYVPTLTRADLQQPWVSKNREIYRGMRDDANDAYATRDTWMYVNIGLRVISVVQSAYLAGLLGGSSDDGDMKVAGHDVKVYAQPMGLYRGTVAATVSF